MNPFQWLTLCCLTVAVAWEVFRTVSGRGQRRMALVRCSVWMAAAAAIAQPGLLQALANRTGIHRGTDLLVYLLAFAFLATAFTFYSRYVRLQRQVIELVREFAILEARRAASRTADDLPGHDA